MDLLYYSDLDYHKVGKQFDKVAQQLAESNFSSAGVKKMQDTGFYRAKLDYENRLLFKFAWYKGKQYILLLEVIYNHEYQKSRFLRGAKIDESKWLSVGSTDIISVKDATEMSFVNTSNNKFHLLDKPISFDEFQEEVFRVKPPIIVIGSAGSGKTALTLEKIKTLKGRVLYVTLSPFLVENSANLYYANHYENEKQEIDFFSFTDFCSTIKIVEGHEMDQRAFNQWMQTRAHVYGVKDVHKVFEEFRGVLTGMEVDKPYLSRSDYEGLGVRRSIFLGSERNKVYDVFEKYIEHIKNNGFYDLNIIAYEYLSLCSPVYDFIVVDEMQDFTNIQLFLLLKSLKDKNGFILCGDSNQIVHPNFFSWTNVKTMFYKQDMVEREVKVLKANFRNSIEITAVANRLLKIKHARFGSIDKESTYLVKPVGDVAGEVTLLSDTDKVRKMFNDKTSRSTKFALLVMRQEDKPGARKTFKTPLLFSIHESKGLEYENVIILNFISGYAAEFNEIAQTVKQEDVDSEELVFSRLRDKTDKSIDTYKFFINSLYVAITRGIKNIYLIETSHKHKVLELLKLVAPKDDLKIADNVSTADEWKKEADRLEKQGKKEHAEEIRKVFFAQQIPDWEPITPANLDTLKKEALDKELFNKKAKDKLFAYALIYDEFDIIEKLSALKYRRADDFKNEHSSVFRKYYAEFISNDLKPVSKLIEKYGINYRDQFNLTPLLAAIQAGSIKVSQFLLGQGADITLMDNNGKNALRTAIAQKLHKASESKLADLVFASFISDTLRLKINDKLVIVSSRKFEYILVNFLIVVLKQIAHEHKDSRRQRGITAQRIAENLTGYPEFMVADFRKKKTYISAMLSKNEVDSSNEYGLLLLMRVERGEYLLNKEIEMMVNDKWTNIYEIVGIDKSKILDKNEQREESIKRLAVIMNQRETFELEREKQRVGDIEPKFIRTKWSDNLKHDDVRKNVRTQNTIKQNEIGHNKVQTKNEPDDPMQTKLFFEE